MCEIEPEKWFQNKPEKWIEIYLITLNIKYVDLFPILKINFDSI